MIICSGFSIKKCKCCVQAGYLTLIFGILSLFISVDSGSAAWGLKYSIVNNYHPWACLYLHRPVFLLPVSV